MPRGRFLSRAISLDEKVDALSDDTARLLFTWMIPHLDCEGRIYGDPQTFKSIVIPRRQISVNKIEKYLIEFEKNGLIKRYSVNGNQYILSKNFEKHQVGLQKNKEAQSLIPPPTPELIQSRDIKTLTQVKVQVKVKDKVQDKDSSSSNIFKVYEEEIGELKPFISDELKSAEELYGAEMIVDAIREAARANKRNWRYICGILKNWEQGGGRGAGKKAVQGVEDQDKYIKGKYRHIMARTKEDVERIKREGKRRLKGGK